MIAAALTRLLAATKAPSYTARIVCRQRKYFVPMKKPLIALSLLGFALAGCARDGDIDSTGGISVTRSACPAIAVPAQTGDVTLFNPPSHRQFAREP